MFYSHCCCCAMLLSLPKVNPSCLSLLGDEGPEFRSTYGGMFSTQNHARPYHLKIKFILVFIYNYKLPPYLKFYKSSQNQVRCLMINYLYPSLSSVIMRITTASHGVGNSSGDSLLLFKSLFVPVISVAVFCYSITYRWVLFQLYHVYGIPDFSNCPLLPVGDSWTLELLYSFTYELQN